MLEPFYPYYLANEACSGKNKLPVYDKYQQTVATHVALADETVIEDAIDWAVQARSSMAKMASYERRAVLEHCVRRFEESQDALAEALCVEAGKPLQDSQGEVNRLIDTFKIAAAEAGRMNGEVLTMDSSSRGRGYRGMWRRVPLGPCSLITPFNFPLNLVAHKVAPAIAVGCPFVLKPASLTPVGALMIGSILAETDLPKGAFSILPCTRHDAEALIHDDRLKLLSFTGSPEAGWAMKSRAGKKKVVLELGGNAAVIVDHDSDLEDAVARIVSGAFYQSGQSCVSVQRILVHKHLYSRFREMMIEATRSLRCGDPHDPQVSIGPMIKVSAAQKLEEKIKVAVQAGGTLLCGGRRDGALLEATLLENVAKELDLVRKEAFGPVAILSCFDQFEEALQEVNDSDFGLQAGVFTRDLYKAQQAWDTLEVGAVLIGEVPSWRIDHMPYGGVKESGLGREGVRFAMEDMTEPRLLVIRTPTAV